MKEGDINTPKLPSTVRILLVHAA